MNPDHERASISVLFVCMGNICRSPTAEAVFRKLSVEAGLDGQVHVDSAGTHGYHEGAPPDPRAVAAARERGFDLAPLRARRVSEQDFERFDLILAMDEDNLEDLQRVAPEDARAELRLLLDFAQGRRERAIPDPYYGGRLGFERVLDLVAEACAGLVTDLQRRLR